MASFDPDILKCSALQNEKNCVMCGACAGGCPVGAISEGDAQYQIDADACIDCGACAGTCPTGAISEA